MLRPEVHRICSVSAYHLWQVDIDSFPFPEREKKKYELKRCVIVSDFFVSCLSYRRNFCIFLLDAIYLCSV